MSSVRRAKYEHTITQILTQSDKKIITNKYLTVKEREVQPQAAFSSGI